MEDILRIGHRILISLTCILLVLVLLIQIIYCFEPFGSYLNVALSMEGERIEEDLLIQQAFGEKLWQDYLIIRPQMYFVSGLPKAKILLNDKLVGYLDQLEKKIYVSVGDYVTIDVTAYASDLFFSVLASEGIKDPGIIQVPAKGKYTFSVGPGK